MAFSDPDYNIEQFGLQQGMHVADFGAGSGFYSLPAARAVGPNGRIYAIEVQKDLMAKLKNEATKLKILQIETIWGDIEKIGGTKLREASIDAAIISNVMFQAHDKHGILEEARRILKPKGRILFVEWADSYGGTGPETKAIIAQPAAEELFRKAGFEFDRQINAGDHHYGMVFRLPSSS